MGILQKKCRTTGKKALAYRGKGGQNTGTAFPALRLGVVLYLLRMDLETMPLPIARWVEHRVSGTSRDIGGKVHEACRTSKPSPTNIYTHEEIIHVNMTILHTNLSDPKNFWGNSFR